MSGIPEFVWVNLYPPFAGQIGTVYVSRELADQMASSSRLACVRVDLRAYKQRSNARATELPEARA